MHCLNEAGEVARQKVVVGVRGLGNLSVLVPYMRAPGAGKALVPHEAGAVKVKCVKRTRGPQHACDEKS